MIRSAVILAALSVSATALATPLKLEYWAEPLDGGIYRYHFTLTLDNNDGSWQEGQRFNWITWADVPYPGPTTMPDFRGDPPAPAPFDDEGFTTSGGGHNGPTLLDQGTNHDLFGWQPRVLGEALQWSGTSAVDFPEGSMMWSNLIGTGTFANFETAIRTGGDTYCPADYDLSGGVDGSDVEAFFRDWEDGLSPADVNRDGSVEGSDVETFFVAWEAGGC